MTKQPASATAELAPTVGRATSVRPVTGTILTVRDAPVTDSVSFVTLKRAPVLAVETQQQASVAKSALLVTMETLWAEEPAWDQFPVASALAPTCPEVESATLPLANLTLAPKTSFATVRPVMRVKSAIDVLRTTTELRLSSTEAATNANVTPTLTLACPEVVMAQAENVSSVSTIRLVITARNVSLAGTVMQVSIPVRPVSVILWELMIEVPSAIKPPDSVLVCLMSRG